MWRWEQETFEIVNKGHFHMTNPGPLHAPVHTSCFRYDDDLHLILETRAPAEAKSTAEVHPRGTLRTKKETVELKNVADMHAVATGVFSTSYRIHHNIETGQSELIEKAHINQLEAVLQPNVLPAYTIDWIANLRDRFHWPDSIDIKNETTQTTRIGSLDEAITRIGSETRKSGTQGAVKLKVDGVQIYLCALRLEYSESLISPGCIIYYGKPDERFRKKVQVAISFALGTYLVDLGSTLYSEDWHIVSFKSHSAYSIDRKAFSLPVLPPVPLGVRWQNEITREALDRLVNAIFKNYESLNFEHVSWAYWHALCATPHIAPVHFGAAIETLLRGYVAMRPERFSSKIIPGKATWKGFSAAVEQVIAELEIPDANKQALIKNLGNLNRVNIRDLMNAVSNDLGIKLGDDEWQAWDRRNDAAHGMELKVGEELALIQDVKLLKIIFHRLLLRIVGGCASYIDYASLDFPIRGLDTPVPPIGFSA
jgi:hypothetical protein